MIITCPECETRYQAEGVAAGTKPRKVRCAKCAHVWTHDPSADEGASPAAPAMEKADAGDEMDFAAPEPEQSEPIAAGEAEAFVAPARAQFSSALSGAGARSDEAAHESVPGLAAPVGLAGRIASLVLALIVLLGIGAVALQYRVELVRAWPPLASLYALVGLGAVPEGLEVRNTNWSLNQRDGMPLLTIRGEIHNAGAESAAVPRLRLEVRDKGGHELYHWSIVLDQKRLGAGEVARFSAFLPSPPAEAEDIAFRFEPQAR